MNIEEKRLRKLVRAGIHVISERRNQQESEEHRLRDVIRYLISEVKGTTNVANRVIHKNSGINALDTLLKNIIKLIEDPYKDLSSNELQRKSFRYHFLINFKNALAPIKVNKYAPGGALTEQDEPDPDISIEIEDDDDINAPPDPSKFIPARPEDEEKAKEEKEKEEGFIKLDTDDPNVQQGAAFAEKAWAKVEKQIQTVYEELIAPEDAKAFYDYGLTNLKLYFDKFEDEMAITDEEPGSPDYPTREESPPAGPLAEVYEINLNLI